MQPRGVKLRHSTMRVGGVVRRREFITRLGSAAAAWPLAARAQVTGRHYRIAMLEPQRSESLLDELGQTGFVEGRNLDIDGRGLGVAAASYETVAVELTEARPDVLMVAGPEAARAAQKATQRIPIVALADDLLGSKLVASMPHPDGNTTGVAIFAFQLDVKRLELLHEVLPGARRIARPCRPRANTKHPRSRKCCPRIWRRDRFVFGAVRGRSHPGDSRDEGCTGRGSQSAVVANIVGRIPLPDPRPARPPSPAGHLAVARRR